MKIAVVLPCYNEEVAIEAVIDDFRSALPDAEIHVFDNNSKDRTSELAKAKGAIVHCVKLKGKGNVVRRMFADVDADVYVMADGDATYHAASAPRMIQRLIDEHLDMLVGTRKHSDAEAYRNGHQFGNAMLTNAVRWTFGGEFSDMLSGYRVFSRRFAKSFPAMSKGFEIETELTVHTLELRLPYGEHETPYFVRPEGSFSKLSTYKDGFRILRTIVRLLVLERPLWVGIVCALVLAIISVGLATPLAVTYFQSGEVPRLPTALLSTGLMIVGVVALSAGALLEAIAVARREQRRLTYLSMPRALLSTRITRG